MLQGSASDYFGSLVARYDSLIARAVPRYHEMTERLLLYAPEHAERVLELGCGTGNLSVRIAARYPTASLTLVDASDEMLAVARSRIDPARDVALLATRFEDLEPASLAFDLVASCISLHHVEDKAALFRRLHAILRPGGTLALADQMRGATDASHALNWSRWQAFCRRPGHCTEDELESLVEHAEAHDHYTPVLEHVRLLESAGFVDLDVPWRNWMWGVVTARRAAG